jgi:hypothetical protein
MPSHLVGGDVDSWCNRCQLMLAHTIHAIADGKIKRVHCNTCKQQHAFRARKPGEKAVRQPGAKTPGRRTSTKVRPPVYQDLIQGRSVADASPYTTRERFQAGALVAHPLFGVGVVTNTRDGRKVDVLFEQGARTLVQGR